MKRAGVLRREYEDDVVRGELIIELSYDTFKKAIKMEIVNTSGRVLVRLWSNTKPRMVEKKDAQKR